MNRIDCNPLRCRSLEGSADRGASHSTRVQCYGSGAPGRKFFEDIAATPDYVSIKVSGSRTGYTLFIILRISEPEDYVVQIRTDRR